MTLPEAVRSLADRGGCDVFHTRIEEVMEAGPTTVLADADLAETIERLRCRAATSLIVSTPEETLLGVVHAEPVGP